MFAFGDKEWAGLSKLVEECGEVLQVAGKLIQTRGAEQHWDGTNLRERLAEELADLQAALTFFGSANGFDVQAYLKRADEKIELFRKWHTEGDNRPPIPKTDPATWGKCDACGYPNKEDGCCSRAQCYNSD